MPSRTQFSADLHIHSVATSHAYSTVNEYAQHAGQIGIRLFALTDHGPGMDGHPPRMHFSNLRIIPHILYGVGVLRGIEANILPEGPDLLDCDERLFDALDIVLAGFHKPCSVDKGREKNTARLIEVIKSGRVQIISHPGNPNFPLEARAVAQAAAEHNVALEINNASSLVRRGSFEVCVNLISELGQAGGMVSIASDAHHTHSMGRFAEALKILEEARFPLEHVINTSPENVLIFLEQHGKDLGAMREFFERQ